MTPIEELPASILLIIAGIDVLVHEELSFVKRVKEELKAAGLEEGRTVMNVVFEKAFHGWFECKLVALRGRPSANAVRTVPYLPRDLHADKLKAQELAIDFIAKAQRDRAAV